MKKEMSKAAKGSETALKSKTPVYVRVLAIILAVFIAADFALVGISKVDYSVEDYSDSQTQDMAAYIQKNDEYLNAGFLQRMRNAVRSLGKPRDFEENYMFASVAIADNDYEKAIGYLSACVEMYTGDPSGLASLLVKRGCLYALDDNWETAKVDLSAACEKTPDEAQIWLMLAKTCYNTNDYEEGAAALSTYASMAELGYDEYSLLASMQFNSGDYDGAVDSCTKALDCQDCLELEIYGIRAKASYLVGDFETAREDSLKCIELGGDYTENMTFAAACYEGEGDYNSVLSVLLEMIANGVEDDSTYKNALTCAINTDNYEAQKKLAYMMLERDHDEQTELTLHSTLAAAQLQLGEYDSAKETVKLALEKDPENLNFIYLRGMCRMKQNIYSLAYEDFTNVIDGGILVEESHYNRAVCQLGLGFKDGAKNELKGIIQRNADSEIVELAKQLLEGM